MNFPVFVSKIVKKKTWEFTFCIPKTSKFVEFPFFFGGGKNSHVFLYLDVHLPFAYSLQ